MSLPISLDEYTEVELRAELMKRERLRAKGLCDYCERRPDESPCRFPGRHKRAAKVRSRN